MLFRLRFVVLTAVSAGLAATSSATLVIDDFTQGATSLGVSGGTGFQETQQSGINVPSGQRDVLLVVTSNPYLRSATYDISTGQGMSFYSSGPAVGGFFALDYDGADSEGNDGVQNPGTGMDLNLIGAGNVLRLNFAFADQGLNIQVDGYTYEGNGHSQVLATLNSAVNSSTNVDIVLGGWTTLSGGGVNFSDVDRLVFTFSGFSAAGDFALTNISAVPEPASMSALALGALGLLTKRRRRK